MQRRWPRIMTRPVVGKTKQRTDPQRHRLGTYDRRWLDRFSKVLAVRNTLQIRLHILRPEVEGPFMQGYPFDEGELAIGQLQAQHGQGLEASRFGEVGRH